MDVVAQVVGVLSAGGPSAIFTLLLLLIGGMIRERSRLLSEVTKLHEKQDKLLDRHHEGVLRLAEALQAVRAALDEIDDHVDRCK